MVAMYYPMSRRALGGVVGIWLLIGSAAVPGHAVTVNVVPPDTTVQVGEDVILRITTDAFADLKAFELIFEYDPTHVELVGVSPGDVLTSASGGYTAFVRDEFAAPEDSVWYDAAVLAGSSQGPGILAFFHFRVLAGGSSPIVCKLVDFRDSANQQTLPDCAGGMIRGVSTTATVWIEPADTTIIVGQDAILRVVTDDVEELEAFEFIFQYDPAFIGLISVIPGDILTTAPGGFSAFVRDEFAAPEDSVWYNAAVLGGSTQGPGILAYLQFTSITEGTSSILCRLVDFRNSLNQQRLPSCMGGIIRVEGPIQANSVTWGRLKSTYR
jgi:hypothetical protein